MQVNPGSAHAPKPAPFVGHRLDEQDVFDVVELLGQILKQAVDGGRDFANNPFNQSRPIRRRRPARSARRVASTACSDWRRPVTTNRSVMAKFKWPV